MPSKRLAAAAAAVFLAAPLAVAVHGQPAWASRVHQHPSHVARPSAKKAPPRPAVLVADATPAQLPSSGGAVTVTGSVRGATRCRLAVLKDSGIKVALPEPDGCFDGMYGETVRFGPDKTDRPVTIKLGLFAAGPKSTSSPGAFYVVVAGKSAAAPFLLPRQLPPATTTKAVAGKAVPAQAWLPRTSTTTVTGVAVYVHYAPKVLRSGQKWRLAIYDVEDQVIATAPASTSCGSGQRFWLHFGKPVPARSEVSLGLEQGWAGSWVPASDMAYFQLARSPVVLVVAAAKDGGMPVVSVRRAGVPAAC